VARSLTCTSTCTATKSHKQTQTQTQRERQQGGSWRGCRQAEAAETVPEHMMRKDHRYAALMQQRKHKS
jgi:hypothetical protein